MAESLRVNLGDRSYAIHFWPNLSARVQAEVRRRAQDRRPVAVLTDTDVSRGQHAELEAMCGTAPRLAIEAGEGAKSFAGLGRVLDFLADSKLDRGGVLLVVGG